MTEQWKQITGFENYEISSLGRARRSKDKRLIKPKNEFHGYLEYRLVKNGKRHFKKVHRLVAIAFIPNPDGLETVNHKDGDKTNNSVENLEWLSLADNIRHSMFVLGNIPSQNRKRIKCIETGEIFDSITSACKKISGQQGNVSRAIKKGWAVKGYHFVEIKNGE